MNKIKFIFAWYDFWIGWYWDRDKRILYIFPVPCFGIAVRFKPKHKNHMSFYIPPLHYNCKCRSVPFSKAQIDVLYKPQEKGE